MNGLFQILGAALTIWQHKLANKYRDRYEKQMRILKDEYSKDEKDRDHGVINDAEFELHLLVSGFIGEISRQKAENPS